jgi:hypothetical protein
MTKNRFILIAAFFAVHSAVIAGNILRTGQISPYSQQGFGALSTHVLTFIGMSLLVLTVRQKIWRTGGILAALSALSRSCITSFPDQKMTFGIITLVVSSAAIAALVFSWRSETFDLSWWERTRENKNYTTTFLLLVVIATAGIFLYWSRG